LIILAIVLISGILGFWPPTGRNDIEKDYLNPVNFLDRAKDPNDPEQSLEGNVMATMDYIRSFDGPPRTPRGVLFLGGWS